MKLEKLLGLGRCKIYFRHLLLSHQFSLFISFHTQMMMVLDHTLKDTQVSKNIPGLSGGVTKYSETHKSLSLLHGVLG